MNALLHVLKNHRPEVNHSVPTNDVPATEKVVEKLPSAVEGEVQENCPVIRANQVFLSATNSGRMRIVFF